MSQSPFGGNGRPETADTRRRTAKFLHLVAHGKTWEQAGRDAKIGPWRALRLVQQRDFDQLVKAIRDSADEAAA